MLVRLLAKAGADVVAEVATGEQAIDWVADNNVNVIVMDVQMPGIGGVEATASIKRAHPHVTILGFTALAEPQRTAMVGAGATAVFDKIDTQPLIDAVIAVRHSGG